MYREFTHAELDKYVESISGYYVLDREETMDYADKKVLYVLGRATVDSSCCGVGGCGYALVPGYVHTLRARQNDEGQWVSEVQPIEDEETRRQIAGMLKEKELVQQVVFV